MDKKLWKRPATLQAVVYALDTAHLFLTHEPVIDSERTALFKERARVSPGKGQYPVERPKVYDFYSLDEADYTGWSQGQDPER